MATTPAFERLHPRVQRWVWTQGWRELRDVQERAVEPVLEADRDVLLAASTAAGKTEAAFLPIASRLVAEPAPGLQALYVSPLKALINDQHRRLEEICEGLEIDVHRWHGDVPAGRKRAVLEDPRGVLLITPESLEALFVLRGTRVPALFEHLGWIVVDELHAFLEGERGRQLQSLLHRVELAVRLRIPRVGLSATLGDATLARDFLRPRGGEDVVLVESGSGDAELLLQVRAHEEPGAEQAIAEHVFRTLRGESHLVFANARRDVESLASRLRGQADRARLPNEFFPHHGSLSRPLREELEAALRDPARPRTVVCTSTLELGLDVGSVASVAQLGAPPSVASLRQRLGRSGRRGTPSVLRIYAREPRLAEATLVSGRLREELVQTVASCELLLEGWCEPPEVGELHLSTLIQQVLSSIAQHSGARADGLFATLCGEGPFESVDASTFAALLRAMGAADLLVQDAAGTLLPGLAGERLLGDHRFFAAFETPEEFRVVHEGRELGTIPVRAAVLVDAGLVLAGRPWRVRAVDEERREMQVVPGRSGDPPLFQGGGGLVHDAVRARMRAVLGADGELEWLSRDANRLLAEARATFAELELDRRRVLAEGDEALFLPWAGDRVMNTLAVALASGGGRVTQAGLVLRVEDEDEAGLWRRLADLEAEGVGDALALAATVRARRAAKHDRYLTDELLTRDYAARALDLEGTLAVVRAALEGA